MRKNSRNGGVLSKDPEEDPGVEDETYIKVGGSWMYLYRAVDGQGKTVESYLSRTRDITAVKALFRKALKHHGEPRTITLDGFEPSHAALRRMGMRNKFNFRWANPVKIRGCKYLNNIVSRVSITHGAFLWASS